MATYAGDTSSSAKTNYARLGHASQSLIPKLLQQLLLFYEPRSRILNDCLTNSYLKNKLNANEWINIRKANTDGYVDFDIPLIYKLLRNLKLIPPPTRGWEPQGGPALTETTIGDDLERFRKSRNEILHRGNTNVSDRELTEYFTQFKEIAQRLELALNKKTNELVSEFQNLETCCMDGVSEQILVNLAKKEKEFTLPNEISEYLMCLISNVKSTDSRTLIKKPLQDVCCVEGEIACLSCEIIEDETAVTWYKDDVEIIPSTDIILKVHGKIHELSIPRTEMKDGGRYSIKVKQSTSEAKLTVKALISNHLVDTTCLEGSTIVLSCEVSVENIDGIWYKDDSIVVQSNQIYPTVNGRIHQLNIFQSEIRDGGKYVFKIRDKISSAILTVKAMITKHLENVTCIEDQSLSLVCELAEKDISVTWLKDEKVIEASKNIVPEVHNNAYILKFKKLSKNNGGKYALMARGKKTEAVVLVKAKSTIPDQILQMDEKDKEMYLEIIKSGTERRYYIRLMIVGENGVGKTCLMRRLLGENIDDVTSTDGIDVVIRKCKIRLSDGKWILHEEDTVEQDRNVRMKRALTDKDTILPEAMRRNNRAEPLLQDVPLETTVIPFGNVNGEEIKNVTEIKDIYTGKVMDQKNDVAMQFTNELKESIAESVPLHTDKDVTLKSEKRVGLLDSLSDVMNVELPKEFFADCAVWDFAGQKEFYATHQTFLTNCAIYLLTADLSKELSSQRLTKIYDVDFGKVGCYIDFWLDTIHCYATTESPDQSVDEPTLEKLEPPIIIVCTGTDKIEGELSEQKSSFVRQLNSILKRQSTRKHIRNIQYLSNKEPLEKDFLELQSAIFETATEMSSWGKELPLRWIHLETALDGERDAGSNILPFRLVVKLAQDSSLPTSDNEEIILFLRYQHECGHVIFFKDLPDYIILSPRWLIDAFKCLVSAHQFQRNLIHLDDWIELEETGKLTNKLISKLFEKVPKLKFTEYKEHLLHVLEKFDIIVKPNIENMTSYYMPCMVKPSSFNVICDQFGVHTPSCHRTSWLLLEFKFLPPAFFNHLLVGYIRKFNISIESTENGARLALYRGIGVFDIDKTGCRKLVLCADKNLIAFQIWIFGNVLHSTFHDFRQTLTNMVDMLSERYQICCKYKVMLKCSESDYQKTEGRLECKVFQDDKMYFCPEHNREHECLDVYKYWFSDKVVKEVKCDENGSGPQFGMMGTSDEMKELLSKGTFISYENCVYLGGACNVGKSTLASILIGEKIPQHWKSTDGLTIYFGRNGIDLKKKEMVPLKQGSDCDVLSKVLRGKPDITQETPNTTLSINREEVKTDTTLSKNREEVLPATTLSKNREEADDSNKGDIIPETHTIPQRKDITLSTSAAPNPTLVSGTGNDDVNITDSLGQQSPQNCIRATFLENIKEEIRKGTYKIEIAPSDLVDFGGQRSFDMTHQLFMRHKGTFVLMFNGTIDFSTPLNEYQGETTESILKHWVNSILSFCVDDEDILPKIMFCATHRDKEKRKDRKQELIGYLEKIFKDHKQQSHIVYNNIFFINGLVKDDPEINKLKSKLVDVAFESWDKQDNRIPMAWVPLDLQMSELRLHNMKIISKEELITLNQRNEDLELTDKQIRDFLSRQHSLGKILYFDQQGLDHFIIVQPQSLVNILRSFITAENFWPEDRELKHILYTLTKTGQIPKQDLLKLWSQKKFHQDMPNDDFKKFIIKVLVHLDILVEPKYYNVDKKSMVQSYLVPCIVKRRLPVTDFCVKSDKMICLSYTLLKSSIPAALSFKLIGAAMNVWPLKETSEGICLYHQAAILRIDQANELHISVKDNKIIIYLINKDTKGFIPPNIASTVQECLTSTMKYVLEFYHKSFGKSHSTSEVSNLFEIEVGEWCDTEACYISVPEVKTIQEWTCENKKTHKTKFPLFWLFNKTQGTCDGRCSGLEIKDLTLCPTDQHLARLAALVPHDKCSELVIQLGLPNVSWQNIIHRYRAYELEVVNFVGLYKWRVQKKKNRKTTSFQDLSDAIIKLDYNRHVLCQVFIKEDTEVFDIDSIALQQIPEDDVLRELSNTVGNSAMQIGVELGLPFVEVEQTLFEYPKVIFSQNFDILKKWKEREDKPTIHILMKAMQASDPRGLEFLANKYAKIC